MIMIITTTATMAVLPIAYFSLERRDESIKHAQGALILKALLPFALGLNKSPIFLLTNQFV